MHRLFRSTHVTRASVHATVLVLLVFLSIVAVPGAQSAGAATGAANMEQVTAGGNFTVAVDSTNSPVVEGERLNVSVSVKNTNRGADTQEVTLTVGGAQRDSREVTLEGGESTTVSLTWNTGSGDAGDYTASVATANDTAETDVTVEEPAPANFQVTLDSTTSPVTEGDDLTVTATVENTGGRQAANVEINLTVAGSEQDDTNVTLGAGEATTVELTWATGDGDAGTYTARAATANDTDETDVVVEEAAAGGASTVTVVETNSPVVEGDTLEVTATVANTGDEPVTKTVTLTVDGALRDRREVELGGGENRTVTLAWETADGDAGQYTASVGTRNDTAKRDVTVEEPAADDNEPPTAAIGGSFENTTVRNDSVAFVGNASDPDGSVESYEWTVDGDPAGSGPDLTYTFAEAGEHEVALRVTDDRGATASTNVTVEVTNAPPEVAIEGTVDNTTLLNESVRFTAKAGDPDGDDGALQYEWDFGDGSTATGREVNNPYDIPGNKTITLSVTDDDGATTTTAVTLYVNAPPTVGAIGFVPCDPECDGDPVFASSNDSDVSSDPSCMWDTAKQVSSDANDSDVSSDLSCMWDTNVCSGRGKCEKAGVKLVAPDAEDTDGTVESYEWIVDGDPAGSGPNLTYTFEESGEDEVTLTVTDDRGATASTNVTVEVTNVPPEAAIGGTFENTTFRDESVRFTAEASDTDGTVESYEWTVDGDVVSIERSFAYAFETTGDHEVRLSVTDDDGATTTAERTVTVSVTGENDPPTVSISALSPPVGEPVTVEPEASDPDGNITAYTWEVDGEVVSESRMLEYTFEESGEHEVTLRVTDDRGATASTSVSVSVTGENDPPTVSISALSPPVGEPVTVEPEASDPDGSIESYEWTVDGEVVSDERVLTYTFDEPGEYEVALVVTDDDGAKRTVTRTISVAAASAGGGNDGPGLVPLLVGLLAAVAIGTAGYLFLRPEIRPDLGAEDFVTVDDSGSDDDYNETETIIDPEPTGDSDSGSDDDYNETETIIDPEPTGDSDSGSDDTPGTDSESGAEEPSSDGGNQDG